MKKAGFPGTMDILGSISSKDGVVMYGLLMSIESILFAQFNGRFLLLFQLHFLHVFKLTELQNHTEYKAIKSTFEQSSSIPPSI